MIKIIKPTLSWKQLYITCIFLWSFLQTLVNESLFPIPTYINGLTWYIIRAILLAKILLHDIKITNKAIWSLAILMVGLLSTHYSQNEFLEAFFWFLAAGFQVNIRDIIKTLFKAQMFSVIIVVICSATGLIESVDTVRIGTGELRRSFGFSHPNYLAVKIFQLCMMYVYLVANRLSLKHIIGILFVNYVNYRITDSNTMWSLTFVLIVFLVLYICVMKKTYLLSYMSEFILRILKYICFVIGGVSIYYALNPNRVYNLGIDQESTLMSRLTQMGLYYNRYGITLFGQPLYYHNNVSASNQYAGLYTLDNAYIYLLLGFGICTFVIIMGLFVGTLYKAVKEKAYLVLILLVTYLIYGFMETFLIRLNFNFTLVFLFAFFWKQDYLLPFKHS